MALLDRLITPSKLIVNGVIYPICYEFHLNNKHPTYYATNKKIVIINPQYQHDIDRFIMAAYLTLHKGDKID